MTKILIAGDKYIDPSIMAEGLKKRVPYDLTIETLKFDFPIEQFDINDDTQVPSGMSWDDPNEEKVQCDVREFYGDPFALKGHLKEIDILIVHGAAVPAEVLKEAEHLKAVVVLRGGPVNIPLDVLKERGITVFNTNGKNAEGVAEYTIGLLLSLIRNIAESSSFLKEGVWKVGYYEYNRTGIELMGKTFGLIGFGRIAQHLAHILRGFKVNIIAYDPFVKAEVFQQCSVKAVSLEELLSNSDFVSLHARQPKGEGPILNEQTFKLMKPSGVLINTARGSLIDYKVLKQYIEQNRLRGAVLDVFGDEPFSFYKELLSFPNVVGTPHIAGGSRETVGRAIDMTVDFLESFLRE